MCVCPALSWPGFFLSFSRFSFLASSLLLFTSPLCHLERPYRCPACRNLRVPTAASPSSSSLKPPKHPPPPLRSLRSVACEPLRYVQYNTFQGSSSRSLLQPQASSYQGQSMLLTCYSSFASASTPPSRMLLYLPTRLAVKASPSLP